ncbi:MAG: lipopolysaccharide kinase InaA family protein [Planctomycetota bacterium]
MGTRLLLDKALAPALASAGLSSADALFRLGGPADATSLVTVVDLPVDGTVGRFHLKRYRYGGWATAKGLLGRGTLFGTAPEVAEFKGLEFLREHGVPAVRPVAAASRTEKGRLVAHALLTEHVPDSIDLAARLATPGDPVRDDVATRRRVAQLIGRHAHRMHSEGFVHRDLFPRNVLVRVDEDGPSVWFCDCRRGGAPSFRWKPDDDLATLELDLRGALSRTDRLRILRAYAGGSGLAAWARRILARHDRLARARERRARADRARV